MKPWGMLNTPIQLKTLCVPLLPISEVQDCTKSLPFTYGLLRAIWALWIVRSMKYHQLWPRRRSCELIRVGTSKGHWPQPLLPISEVQDCTKSLTFTYGLLRAIWAWWIVISMKYHQLWPRTRLCELTKVGASKGHRPQPLLSISQLQHCTKSLPFTYGLWTSFTDFSFARLY
jgi:hypothetical protein